MSAAADAVVVATTNGQTVTIVRAADGSATMRVAKDGHNRAVAKLDNDAAAVVSAALASFGSS